VWEVVAVFAALAAFGFLAYRRFGTPVAVVALIVSLSAGTAFVEYRHLAQLESPRVSSVVYLQVFERARHDDTLNGKGMSPGVYRILPEWGAEASVVAAKAAGLHHPYAVGFEAFRVLQNLVIFTMLWVLLRRFRFGRLTAAFGLALFAGAMAVALHNSGLAFNACGDVAFYLIAAVLILDGRYAWIVPLSVVGALNRETSGLIPVMLVAIAVMRGIRTDEGRRALRFGLAALAAYAITYASVRLVVGSAPLFKPFGVGPGWGYVKFNLRNGFTWEYLFRTFNVIPFVALAGLSRWPRQLKAFALAIVPVWLVVHLVAAALAETRLLLVPYAVVVIPGALFALAAPAPPEARANASPQRSPAFP
jgi:hypothetical protein